MSQLLVGAGGWAYFQVPGTDSLEAYSQAFDFVELNSSYYQLPAISSASDWRKRVPDDFRFSVRCPRIIVDNYGLNLLPGARSLLERLGEVCNQLEAVAMTVLINAGSQIKESELAARLSDFLGAFNSDKTVVAVEFRGVKPSAEVFDIMKESEAIDSVDLSNSEPRYEGKVLYSRLFGKGEKNILAFHGVRMYRDAGRVKSFIEKGYFPKITSGVGTESIREVLSEDARFPTTKSRLLKDQGWKVFQDTDEVRKISTVLEKLPEGEFNSLNDLMAELRSH